MLYLCDDHLKTRVVCKYLSNGRWAAVQVPVYELSQKGPFARIQIYVQNKVMTLKQMADTKIEWVGRGFGPKCTVQLRLRREPASLFQQPSTRTRDRGGGGWRPKSQQQQMTAQLVKFTQCPLGFPKAITMMGANPKDTRWPAVTVNEFLVTFTTTKLENQKTLRLTWRPEYAISS